MSMHRLSGCPSCAEPLEEGDRFCGVCGYALSAPPAPPDRTPTLPDPDPGGGFVPGPAAGESPAWAGAAAASGHPGRGADAARPAEAGAYATTAAPGFGSAVGVPAPGWEGTPVPPGSTVASGTAPASPADTPWGAVPYGSADDADHGRPRGAAPEEAHGAAPQANPHDAPLAAGAPGADAPYGRAPSPDPQEDPHEDPHACAPQGSGGGRTCVACRSGYVDTDGYCEHCGHAQPRERDHVEEELCSVAAVSDRGLRHHRNEDSFAVAATAMPDGSAATVAIVCDGVSSASRPDDASAAAAGAASEALLDALPRGAHPAEAMHEAILAAGAAVSALAPQPPGAQNAPACTLVGAVVSSGVLTIGWVGDSRAYWVPDDRAAAPRRLTEDDSWAAQMVAAGLMGEAEAYADVRAHAITGWLGADAYDLDPHTASFRPDHPGVVVVCTDGLWNYAESAVDMARILPPDAAERPLHCAQVLVGHALDGGGHDNITVAVVPFTAAPPEPGAEPGTAGVAEAGAEAGTASRTEPPRPLA
ncbi:MULTISPECIES: protein phosphatase 2C domain-containing protein [Streptomyces]|uniref:protein phosphatase 2C domain-containing protein n=1 Tax=Streptomyces TaxID=1883 RepID=UPI0009A4AFD3|nr:MULTISPECIES: protein phosphatase 2C domain-containing protein [Streptomyces]